MFLIFDMNNTETLTLLIKILSLNEFNYHPTCLLLNFVVKKFWLFSLDSFEIFSKWVNLSVFIVILLLAHSDLLSPEQEMGVFSDKKCYLIRTKTPPTLI